jgi:hypothetical protein
LKNGWFGPDLVLDLEVYLLQDVVLEDLNGERAAVEKVPRLHLLGRLHQG